MASKKALEDCKKVLLSILTSSKEGVDVRNIESKCRDTSDVLDLSTSCYNIIKLNNLRGY